MTHQHLSSALRSSFLLGSAFPCTRRSLSSKIGLGGHKFGRMQPTQYKMVVQTALDQGVDVLECPSANDAAGAVALAGIISQPVTVLQRVGYRTVKAVQDERSGDLLLEQHAESRVVHNMSASFMHECIESSALITNKHIQLIPMVHNPEVHGADALDRLTEAFCGLEEVVKSGDTNVNSFGVVSNGLALAKDHPMHLDYRLVFQAADRACKEVGTTVKSSLSVLQLPANLREVQGIGVARQVKLARPHVHVYTMRPLTYYAEDGTSQAMLDYLLPQGPNEHEWTHNMAGPPNSYHQVLNMALAHFDGEALLEAKQERSLTEEETETLEGAKVLQSMLHDLDASIDQVVSFAAHEDQMVNVVIPTLFGTFEELDEPSVHLLSNFFAAHGWSVRYGLATKMRRMLRDGGPGFPANDISPSVKLQDYALEYLLKEEAIDKVIMGATLPEQIVDAVGLWSYICSRR